MSCEAQSEAVERTAEEIEELAERVKELEQAWHQRLDEMDLACVEPGSEACEEALQRVTQALFELWDAEDELKQALMDNGQALAGLLQCFSNLHKPIA